jgi:hypothetical protein
MQTKAGVIRGIGMEGAEMTTEGILSFRFVLKFTFLCGLVLGIIAAPFYGLHYLSESELLKFILLIVLTPIANGIFLSISGAIGYPVYTYLARRGKFNLDVEV